MPAQQCYALPLILSDAVQAIGITLSQPAKVLGQDRPTSSLLGPLNLASFFGSYIITLCFLIGAIFLMYSDPDYVRWPAK